MATGLRHSRMDYEEDPFSNFSLNPGNTVSRLRSLTKRSMRYQSLASLSTTRERSMSIGGSFSNFGSMASLTGSMQSLVDPSRMMNLREDAKSRRISAEVMKHQLYASVVTSPRRRRFSVRSDFSNQMESDQGYDVGGQYIQSMPVTPAHSLNVSPAQSPTSHRKFHWGYWPSRGHTPQSEQPEVVEEEELQPEDAWKGLASLFRPSPRCISAHETIPSQLHQQQAAQERLQPEVSPSDDQEEDMDMDSNLMPPPNLPPPRHHHHHHRQQPGELFVPPERGGGDSDNHQAKILFPGDVSQMSQSSFQ